MEDDISADTPENTPSQLPPWAPIRLTELEGIGGEFTPSADDFTVVEEPLYEPSGSGDHLYIRFEKRELTTRDVIGRAADVFKVNPRDIGYAGLKDKFATTTQTISVPRIDPAAASALEGSGVRVLDAQLHENKLRTGHLRGNRFKLTIRGAPEGALARGEAILETLKRTGVPGFFGDQRFGRDGSNVQRAFKVLKKGPRAAGSGWKARLLVSALQSALFNDYLRRRVDAGTYLTVLAGDVLMKTDSGGRFVSEDPAADQPRFDAFEVAISGPIVGGKMTRPGPDTVPEALETAVLAAADLTIESFDKVRKLAQGTRRPLRVALDEPSISMDDDGLITAQFGLPAGFYATVVATELLG